LIPSVGIVETGDGAENLRDRKRTFILTYFLLSPLIRKSNTEIKNVHNFTASGNYLT
jgi:hypothetical protein